jgi:hypothetical protein
VSLKPKFEECLTDLYSYILECQIAMAVHNSRSSVARFLRSVPKLDDWAGVSQKINEKDSTCLSFASIFDSEEQDRRHKRLKSLFEEQRKKIEESLEICLHEKDIEKGKEILSWISSIDPIYDHDFILDESEMSSTYDSSGKWLKTNLEYKGWVKRWPSRKFHILAQGCC